MNKSMNDKCKYGYSFDEEECDCKPSTPEPPTRRGVLKGVCGCYCHCHMPVCNVNHFFPCGHCADTSKKDTPVPMEACKKCGRPKHELSVCSYCFQLVDPKPKPKKLDPMGRKIGRLRQWLNEDRITDPNRMVTNAEIKHMLED